MNNEVKKELEDFLKQNHDVMAYNVANMMAIYADVIIHRLN